MNKNKPAQVSKATTKPTPKQNSKPIPPASRIITYNSEKAIPSQRKKNN